MTANRSSDRYQDRLDLATYQEDPEVHFGLEERGGGDVEWVGIPERLVNRLTSLGEAYELHIVPNIDIYADSVFKSHQCEKLAAELEFLREVVSDPVVDGVAEILATLVETALAESRRLLVSGN